jgi:hypothetical protein
MDGSQARSQDLRRLHEVVAKMAETLARPRAVFRDSLVENVSELCAFLPKLNITEDPALAETLRTVESTVAGLNPRILLRIPRHRQQAADKARAMADRVFVFQNGSHSVCDQHDVVEDDEEYSFVKPPRGYAVLSVATHGSSRGQISTAWHRVIAWNTDRDHFGLFRLGKGDQVEVTARPNTYTTRDGRELEQMELASFRLLRRKLRGISA